MLRDPSATRDIAGTGNYIDRGPAPAPADLITFEWNGTQMAARKGESLAASLLAHGERIIGRSFKFHRPRGVVSAGAEESNALVTLGCGARSEPNARATLVRVRPGLQARAQNCWPSVQFDIGRTADFLAPLLPAGFYNKTFIWPSWRVYEPAIRRTAGLGRAAQEPDPDRYEACNASCDLLIVGSGPAGLLSAQRAARCGLRVILVEQDFELGGTLLWDSCRIDGLPGKDWAAKVVQELQNTSNVRILVATTAFGLYDHGVAALVERTEDGPTGAYIRERYWRVRAKSTVLATGAIEQPWVFEQNDLPGIMLASAICHYAQRYDIAAGRRIVFATNNDSAYLAALELVRAGIEVPVLVDSRADSPAPLAAALQRAGVRVRTNSIIQRANGNACVHNVRIGSPGQTSDETIDCDAVGMSGGWVPAVHLFSHARGRLEFDQARHCFLPIPGSAPVTVSGSICGAFQIDTVLSSAAREIDATCASLGRRAEPMERPRGEVEFDTRETVGALRVAPGGREDRQWVDFQYDVTVSDVKLAVREGFGALEHVKRYTTLGMSVDQGKTGNLNGSLIVAEASGKDLGSMGMTTYRPPYTPVTLGALAGRQIGEFYAPRRLLAAHAEHVALDAHFEEAGGWMRPKCYPRPGESHPQAIRREHVAVRAGVGILDASPLGKFEITGPDAGIFLDRFYLNNLMTLKIGNIRYGIMLNERGIIIDDGTIARLGEGHYLVTTTSGGASRIGAWFEEWRQCEWPQMEVFVTPVTAQWATYVVAGAHARDVLVRMPMDMQLSREAFPPLQVRSGTLCGRPARICRVSFSGELCFEINVPARHGPEVWNELMQAGRDYRITPYGLEAALSLRLEKGYLHVGVDTDGMTVPADVGWGEVALKKQADYIGKRSLRLPENIRPDRRQLVGLVSSAHLDAGAHLRFSSTIEASDGWVSSTANSPVLKKHIALALVRGGRTKIGETVTVHDLGRTTSAQICSTAFYDRENERINA